MSLVYACAVPHPPIMVPEVGQGQDRKVDASKQAMARVALEMASRRPEVVFVISPHGQVHGSAMGIFEGEALWGTLSMWGAGGTDMEFKGDPEAAALLKEEAAKAGAPVQALGGKGYELDHGVMVPLYFLRKAIGSAALVPLSFSALPLETHIAFGEAIRKAADRLEKRVALIASGDLSHRLTPDAPYGYEPLGKVFDQKVVEALRKVDAKALLDLDPEMVEKVGECGLRSITILMGALQGLQVEANVLSYEGPFGVGYPVASFGIVEGARPSTGSGRTE